MLRGFNAKNYVFGSLNYYRRNLPQLRIEVLSGMTLALIQVPESIAFAFMAGLAPYYGMASVFWVGTITGLFGGRCVLLLCVRLSVCMHLCEAGWHGVLGWRQRPSEPIHANPNPTSTPSSHPHTHTHHAPKQSIQTHPNHQPPPPHTNTNTAPP